MKEYWWKWGFPDQHHTCSSEFTPLKDTLASRWNMPLLPRALAIRPFTAPAISDKKKELIRDTFANITTKRISFSEDTRLRHSLSKSYTDLLKLTGKEPFDVADAVITPISTEEVAYILAQAAEHQIQIIPYGAGTNIVEAFRIRRTVKNNTCCIVQLQQLNKISISTGHLCVTVQAGISGAVLENKLNEAGYTLGHFPTCFEHSSIGGWLATNSFGNQAVRYGGIAHIVRTITVATPQGLVKADLNAAGWNYLGPVFTGSEGNLGIITEIQLKIRPLPRKKRWIEALLPDNSAGLHILRALLQQDIRPVSVALLDNEAVQFHHLYDPEPTNETEDIFSFIRKQAEKLLPPEKVPEQPHYLLLQFEEYEHGISAWLVRAKQIIEQHHGRMLNRPNIDHWEKLKYQWPYLRDYLFEHEILAESVSCHLPWDQVEKFQKTLRKKLSADPFFLKNKGLLYFNTFSYNEEGIFTETRLMVPDLPGQELKQHDHLLRILSAIAIQHQGKLESVHGTGQYFQKEYFLQLMPDQESFLKMLKQKFDPKNILNTHKIPE